MEAPRLAPTMSGPGSPCEEVLKNLSLEAIQLCERDGKAAPRRPLSAAGENKRRGPGGSAPRTAAGGPRGAARLPGRGAAAAGLPGHGRARLSAGPKNFGAAWPRRAPGGRRVAAGAPGGEWRSRASAWHGGLNATIASPRLDFRACHGWCVQEQAASVLSLFFPFFHKLVLMKYFAPLTKIDLIF